MQGSSVEALIARLTDLSKQRTYTDEEEREIESLYPRVTQFIFRRNSKCANCHRDACIEMIYFLRKNNKFRDKLHYVLRNGVVIQLGFGSSEFYTNANIDDAVAIAYLREHPENISYFQRYPENWREQIAEEKKEVTNESSTAEEESEETT